MNPNPLIPLINCKSYEWADIICNILGVPIVGITSIMYSEKQDMKNIYGAGNRPVSRAYGNIEPNAKLTLLMEEVEAIQAVAPGGNIMNIPEFNVTIVYIDPSLVTRTHILRNVRFTGNVRDIKQGDTSIGVEMDLIISHVEWAA